MLPQTNNADDFLRKVGQKDRLPLAFRTPSLGQIPWLDTPSLPDGEWRQEAQRTGKDKAFRYWMTSAFLMSRFGQGSYGHDILAMKSHPQHQLNYDRFRVV